VSYHPPIFKPLSAFTLANPLQKSLLLCAAAGVSVYSPHTALDTVQGGINDWLASGLVNAHVKGEVEPLNPIIGPNGELEGGTGRLVKLENGVKMETLVDLIKKHIDLPRGLCALCRQNSFLEVLWCLQFKWPMETTF
jgi:putative NIF3 family GTP cyclohydrolase 1 type 2